MYGHMAHISEIKLMLCYRLCKAQVLSLTRRTETIRNYDLLCIEMTTNRT